MINKRHKYCSFLNSNSLWSVNFINTIKFCSNFLFNLKPYIKKKTLIRAVPNNDFNKVDFFKNLEKIFKLIVQQIYLVCTRILNL